MSIRVLIIDDDEDDFLISKHYINKITTIDYTTDWCGSYAAAKEILEKDEYDIYLIDHHMGAGDGTDLINDARSRGNIKPLILLTGTENLEIDNYAMKKGASDFIIKSSVKLDSFERTLRYSIERYKQQLQIVEKEKKYRSLFELSTNPIIILSEDLKILEYNQSFQVSFGEESIVLNNGLFRNFFVKQEDYSTFLSTIKENGKVKDYRTQLRINHVESPVLISVATIPESEVVDTFHVSISDITSLIDGENELKQSEKVSMSGRMARMIAHEVRNPLTNINLAIGELEEIIKDEDAEMYLSMVQRNSTRINTLIEELLSSTKPKDLSTQYISLSSVVEEAIELSKDRINLMNVELTTSLSPIPKGNYDKEKLLMAFTNIISNGIEAMADTFNPKMTISLLEDLNRPTVTITDNGKGMDEETQKNIFEPFFTKRRDGLGLGMTATLSIVRLHNGNIKVKSALGEGATFTIFL